MKEDVIKAIKNNKIIVIVRGVAAENIVELAQSLYDGGIRLMEITYDASGTVSDEETAGLIKAVADKFRNKMFVGAGTVLKESQAALTYSAGGRFVISPDTNTDVIRKTVSLGMVSIPGSFTPTEAQAASRAGADFIKLFPINQMGADYIKAIKAPLSHISFLAVGGVDLSNIADFMKAGVCGVGLGGNIVKKDLIQNKQFDKITELAKKYVAAVAD